jgi:hypothetical protein
MIPRKPSRLLIGALAWLSLPYSVWATDFPDGPYPPPPSFSPRNHQGPSQWPGWINRIVVLPIHDSTRRLPSEVLDQYDQTWHNRLLHTQRAELVPVSREQLSLWIQRPSLDSVEILPSGWSKALSTATGAQAAVFLDLTQVVSQGHLRLGFRIKIVDLTDHSILWTADEIFDSSDPQLEKKIKQSFPRPLFSPREPSARISLSQSPAQFATFAFGLTLRNLPPRVRAKTP